MSQAHDLMLAYLASLIIRDLERQVSQVFIHMLISLGHHCLLLIIRYSVANTCEMQSSLSLTGVWKPSLFTLLKHSGTVSKGNYPELSGGFALKYTLCRKSIIKSHCDRVSVGEVILTFKYC